MDKADIDIILSRLKEKSTFETECWLFRGSSRQGYGQLQYKYKVYTVHRLSAHIYLGLDLIDKQKLVLHKNSCHNRACWNPKHLYIGTYFDNVNDAISIGTHSSSPIKVQKFPTHCKNGHELNKENVYYYYHYGKKERSCNLCRLESAKRVKEKRRRLLMKIFNKGES